MYTYRCGRYIADAINILPCWNWIFILLFLLGLSEYTLELQILTEIRGSRYGARCDVRLSGNLKIYCINLVNEKQIMDLMRLLYNEGSFQK